jgi:hypothetical protein
LVEKGGIPRCRLRLQILFHRGILWKKGIAVVENKVSACFLDDWIFSADNR